MELPVEEGGHPGKKNDRNEVRADEDRDQQKDHPITEDRNQGFSESEGRARQRR